MFSGQPRCPGFDSLPNDSLYRICIGTMTAARSENIDVVNVIFKSKGETTHTKPGFV